MRESLFSVYEDGLDAVPRGLPLVILLNSSSNIGQVVTGAEEHIFATTDPEPLLYFKHDLLLDYRARRPEMMFERDRLTDYQPDTIGLFLCSDSLGKEFLLLSGFEPDYRWERFSEAVIMLAAELEVSVACWVHGIPMPVPHTRPTGMTLSGNRTEFINEFSNWKPTTRISASIGHLLEYRLAESHFEVVGAGLLLPHYLAGTYYPEGIIAALNVISQVTGLIINTEEMYERNNAFLTLMRDQFAGSQEAEMLRTLEMRYDEYVARMAEDSATAAEFENLPSAEEIAAEVEKFLARDSHPSSRGGMTENTEFGMPAEHTSGRTQRFLSGDSVEHSETAGDTGSAESAESAENSGSGEDRGAGSGDNSS